MKFRAVSDQTKMNVMLWSIKKEIMKENRYLESLPYDPTPMMEVVKHHIDRWDPIKLLAMDGPEDEYDGETRTITIYITKHLDDLDAPSLGKAINKVLGDSFRDEFQADEQSIEIASSIIYSLRSDV
ncbi:MULTISPECIES: hypothetical protein [unclassified Paenibacillus]|uniref:hypothetical protein n=1 Tax=unclassified Paenibacillus TaxID=185978 RepID=UPI00070F7D2A|nr:MULTISPECIES: hypothetical protein [unclassified Paenibacillus]KQX69043.1 hypothetical protein ASD40_00645 [Paenibacillus sp. Root444D2]KRE51589.1 hypothetical protein ASG85_00145 [Paenibacillus sp. Soil724D2]